MKNLGCYLFVGDPKQVYEPNPVGHDGEYNHEDVRQHQPRRSKHNQAIIAWSFRHNLSYDFVFHEVMTRWYLTDKLVLSV